MKTAVVTPIPTPYRDPFWNAVARQPGVDLSVFYCAAGKSDRPWEVSWTREFHGEVLPGRNLAKWRGADASCFWNPTITRRLKNGRFDAIVLGGYNHLTMLAARRFALRRRIPYFMMCESHLQKPRSPIRRWLKERFVRRIVTRAAGGFPTGILARQYLEYYGADPKNLTLIPNVPDVEHLAEDADTLRPKRERLRNEYGLDQRPVVLFAGRLIPKKRADLLIRAFGEARESVEAELVIVGDGPQRPMLEELVGELGLADRIHFAGFVQPAEMPTWYAMADLFVLPSSETWGVVVLEALASGLPVIVSDEAGCHPDVVTGPAVGDVVPAGDPAALARVLTRRLACPGDRAEVRKSWSATFESIRYAELAERFVGALTAGAFSRCDSEMPHTHSDMQEPNATSTTGGCGYAD